MDPADRRGSLSRRRVWVRGLGAVSALGRTWADTRRALAEGRRAIGPISRFDAADFPCPVAAEVTSETVGGERRVALALPAAREAWGAAQCDADPARVAVFVGSESGRVSFEVLVALGRGAGGAGFDAGAFMAVAAEHADSLAARRLSPASVASAIARQIRAEGSVDTLSLACASGSAAIIEASRAIQLGECDVALAGGVGADVDPMMLAAFALLGATSERGVSCPFDVRRDGFVLGEGAAMVVLAAERGDSVIEVAGAGRTLDGYRITAPDPEGSGARRAIRQALVEAGTDSVDYVQAHGTSTPLNDRIEALALRRALGAALDQALVGSVKGALGHWIAGAGALGFLCGCEAVANGLLLPTAGLEQPDPECDLPHIVGKARERRAGSALVNAFGFGGANTSIVLRRAA